MEWAYVRILNEVVNISETQFSVPCKALVVSEVVSIAEEVLSSLAEEVALPPIDGAPSIFHYPYVTYKTRRKPKPTIELPMKVTRFRYNIESSEIVKKTQVSNRVRFRYDIRQKATIRNLVANAIVDRLASNTIIQHARKVKAIAVGTQGITQNDKKVHDSLPPITSKKITLFACIRHSTHVTKFSWLYHSLAP